MMTEKQVKKVASVLNLNVSFLAILQAVDFSKFGGNYNDFNNLCQGVLKLTEKELKGLVKAGNELS